MLQAIGEAPGAHLDSETYALILAALARNGAFYADAQSIEGVTELGYSQSSGPKLLDELLTLMMEDLVEISEEAALMLSNGFQAGFAGEQHVPNGSVPDCSQINNEKTDSLLIGRVTIDKETATCPFTGVKLRLLTLEEDQRRHLNTTLLNMAITQQQEFSSRKKGESRKMSGQQAEQELLKFGEWLE